MGVVDDPMLALIARFVVEDIDNLGIPDEEFMQQQADEINRYVGEATGEERHRLALQWIREHAEHYRLEWQKKKLSRMVLDKRCADCPLMHRGTNKRYCTIHSRWVTLLKEYLADQISSERYVKETLALLDQQKSNLKITTISPHATHG